MMHEQKSKNNRSIAAPFEKYLENALIAAIALYKKTFTYFLGGQCRFTPSCSDYAIEAIRLCGPIKGIYKTFTRLLRCNPFARGGYDPLIKEKY